MHPQIAPKALDRIFFEIAIAAKELERIVDNIAPAISRKPLGHGGKARLVRRIGRDLGGGEIEQRARRFELGRHIGKHELGVLEIRNRLAELLAFLCIGNSFVETALRAAQAARTDIQPSAIKARHCEVEPLAFLANAVFNRHATIFEDQLGGRRGIPSELLLRLAERKAGRVLFDDEAGYALALMLAGANHHDIDIIITGAGDKLLRAV